MIFLICLPKKIGKNCDFDASYVHTDICAIKDDHNMVFYAKRHF
jgi:hypothetical protein